MFGAFILIEVLAATVPVLTVYDGPPIQALTMAAVATGLAIVAATMPPREAGHCSQLFRLTGWALALPAIWIAVQIVPLPIRSLSNPIWRSVEPALGRSLFGSITVDYGKTVVALAQYLLAVGVVIATSAVTINRDRAERVLLCITLVTTAMALMLIADQPAGIASYTTIETLRGGSALGTVAAAASAVRLFETREKRAERNENSSQQFVQAAVSLGGLLICWVAVIAFAPSQLIFATACGFAISILVACGRWLAVPNGVITSFVVLGMILAIGFAAISSNASSGDLTLRYSTAPHNQVLTAERMRGDAGWLGTGAGTFAAVQSIYQEGNLSSASAPTTAAAIAIELGSPVQWILVVLAILAVALFMRGALQRGRDSFYPCLAASAMVVVLIEAFIDDTALRLSIALLASTIAGLGLAQVVSRTGKLA